MSNMTTKSDFAQKLLHDLRQRKERMAVTQNSSRQSSQTSRVMHGNSGQTSRSGRRINALESSSSITGNTSRRSNGSSRSANIKESSNQIVLYGSGQSSRQVRDLSMAIAFAFENSGNLTKIGASSSNPLVNFFNRFNRRSPNSQKMEITSFNNQSLSTNQFPTVSHIHINEIARGVHKLNQILRACSNGLNFDRNSIEVGRELLKGAIDLEESLRMLVNLQEGSQYINGTQKKSRLKLLEEDEDDQDDNNRQEDQWKLDRPRFSFDKQGARRQQLALSYTHETSESNSKLVPHKRSTSYVQDLSLSTQVKLNDNKNLSYSTQEKGRISNVIAKLMGLEEISLNEDSTFMKNDVKGKQGKVSSENNKSRETLIRESRNGSPLTTNKKSTLVNSTPPIRESKLQLKPEKKKTIKKGDQESHPSVSQGNGHQNIEDSRRNQRPREDKQSKTTENESKIPVLNTDQQKKPQNSKTLNAAHKRHSSIEQEVTANSMEKRNADKDFRRNQQKPQEQHMLLQEHVTKRAEQSEDKQRADKKGQKFPKQNLMAKNHEGQQVDPTDASKSKRSTTLNGKKKLSHDKSPPGNGGSMRPTEKAPTKDPLNRIEQDAVLISDISQKTASNQESFKKEGQSQNSITIEPENDTESSKLQLTNEKTIEVVPSTQKRSIHKKVQRSEIPQKIDVLITKRNATVNHQARSTNKPANMLKGLKQQMHNKNRRSKIEEKSDCKVEKGKTGINVPNAELIGEAVKLNDKFQNEDDQTFKLNTSVADEFQIQNLLPLNNGCETIVEQSFFLKDLKAVEQPFALEDEEELMRCDQIIGAPEKSTELYDLSEHGYKQCLALVTHEQLTEPEKQLKETIIKSQRFLSTAEALFKLNIPMSFLHAGDIHDNEAAEQKLVLNCAYEVMKRKARRHEIACHPYMRTTVTSTKVWSLDDLVKQLCKDLEMLKFYGMNGGDECDVAAGLYQMLNKDIYNESPDVNSMWDFEWSKMMSIFPEIEDVVKDVERHMLNGLLDEITNEFLLITVSARLFE